MKNSLIIVYLLASTNIVVAQTRVNNKLQEILCSYEEYIDVIRLTQGKTDFTQEEQKSMYN